jgi:hypothetical protein
MAMWQYSFETEIGRKAPPARVDMKLPFTNNKELHTNTLSRIRIQKTG